MLNVLNNKKLSKSSKRWLVRHMNDKFVKNAKSSGFRSRSAYKLLEIDDKFRIFNPLYKQCIVDLGAAPGGWSQVALMRNKNAKLYAVDVNNMTPLYKVKFLKLDFTENQQKIYSAIESDKIDVLLSDMLGPASGDRTTDHLRSMNLCEYVSKFAIESLNYNASLVMKTIIGGEEKELIKKLSPYFKHLTFFKPQASRKTSSEIYIIATKFKSKQTT